MMRGVLVLLLGLLFTSATGGATAEATKVARFSHRKLLQEAPDPFILSPLVPINWFIFRDAPTFEFNLDDPVFGYWVSFTSSLLRLNALSIELFGDLPLVELNIPQFSVFGGNGWNPLDEEGILAGASIAELAAWLEVEFFNLAVTQSIGRVRIFDRFGFEDLGLPGNFGDHYEVPWSADGLVEVNIVDDSFVNWVRTGGLADLLSRLTYPGFSGVNFSSI